MDLVRPAAPDDLDGIVEVFWACWTRSYAAFARSDELARLDLAAAATLWRTALERPGTTLVAERDGVVVGLARSEHGPDLTQVHSLYVHPDAQGGGLGGRLLDAAVDGAPRARLWVFSANRQARSFYARHGWVPDGVTRVQPQFGLPETRLVREPPGTLQQVAARLTGPEVCLAGETPPAGAVVGVTGRGLAAAGTRDLAGRPVTIGTWFDLASVTKLVTTVAVLVLVSRGLVDPDAPAGRYWPPAGDVRVRDLLLHRSGLLPWQPLYAGLAGSPGNREAALALALALPRETPGTQRYSDLGFMVLGECVAAVAGQSLPRAISSLVCEPLGIDLRYAADLDPDAPVASSSIGDRVEEHMVATGEPYPVLLDVTFTRWRAGEVRGAANDGNCCHALEGVSGHAGLFGRVADLLRLGAELACPRVLDAATVASFTDDGPDAGQALGFRTRTLDDGRRLIHHPGFTGCTVGFVPGGRAYVVASNRLLTDGTAVPTQRLLDVLVALSEGGS